MSVRPHVMFAGGGVSGHFFPGLAVAEHLANSGSNLKISFAGPGKAREKHTTRIAGFDYVTIPSKPVPQNPFQAFRFLTDNVAGYCAARWMLREQEVSLVVGLGGFTSTAVVRAALSREIPVILLEQNAIPSRTTSWYANDATLVCAGFEELCSQLSPHASVSVCGNPSRPAFEKLYKQKSNHKGETLQFPNSTKRLVVLGGAGGARSLNESMPAALRSLSESLTGWQIIHQTGEGQLQETESRYKKHGVEALTVSFIDEIASVLFASDLVVCRSGGTTLAELALAGVPAVLVPYPQTQDDHQMANAKVYASSGASRLINESRLSGRLEQALAAELLPLLQEDETRRQMSQNMCRLAHPLASEHIAEAIQNQLFGRRAQLQAA